MYYNVLKLKDLINLDGGKYDDKVLLETQNGLLKLIVLKKDGILDTHTSDCDAAVYVLEGEIEMHFDAEKFQIDKGEMLMFKKDKEHKVLAKKDSKYLLIKL